MSRQVDVCAQAPGKINPVLCVGPAREDGYHDLATVFAAVSLHDTIRAAHAKGFSVAVTGADCADVPTDESNLALRAARALAAHTGYGAGARLRIDKDVPVAGGMAGGSADAAGALVACDALWGTRVPHAELQELAAALGADVPFALLGGIALGTGRGDELVGVLARGGWHWVLALTELRLSTAAVFAELDRQRAGTQTPPPSVPDDALMALRAGDPIALGAALHNDLQLAALALQPALGATLRRGLDAGACGALVSGSGPTTAFLAVDHHHSSQLAAELAKDPSVRAVRQCTSPAAGARVAEEVVDRVEVDHTD